MGAILEKMVSGSLSANKGASLSRKDGNKPCGY